MIMTDAGPDPMIAAALDRGMKPGGEYEGYLTRLRRLAKRDGWKCGICGGAIDPTLKYPNLQSRSIDHVIPKSVGGTDEEGNLQLAHLRCNALKGPGWRPTIDFSNGHLAEVICDEKAWCPACSRLFCPRCGSCWTLKTSGSVSRSRVDCRSCGNRFFAVLPLPVSRPAQRIAPMDIPMAAVTEQKYTAGDKVFHPSFGFGDIVASVLNRGDEEVTVAFVTKGVKKLSVAYAALKKTG